MTKPKFKTKCVQLKGELSYLGKHILMPFGVTLCGVPTPDCDAKQFPQIKEGVVKDLVSEYTDQEWDITCIRCLDTVDILEKHRMTIN